MFGIAPDAVTTTVDVFVQPFVASVEVTVYVPAADTIAGFGLFNGNEPPFHTIVFPRLVPVSVVVKLLQSILLLLTEVTVGAVVFVVTATVVVAVHPFAGSVTVTVYVFAAFTVAVEVAAPAVIPTPVQLNVAPGVVELAVIFPLNVVHVNISGAPAVAVGAVVFVVTATVVVAVHPFAGFVTVTVYVFAAFTVAVEVAAPAVIPAPVQLNVAPGVVELAVIFPLNVVHVNTKGNPAVAVGGTRTVVGIIIP